MITRYLRKPHEDILRACTALQFATLKLHDGNTDKKSVLSAMRAAQKVIEKSISALQKGTEV